MECQYIMDVKVFYPLNSIMSFLWSVNKERNISGIFQYIFLLRMQLGTFREYVARFKSSSCFIIIQYLIVFHQNSVYESCGTSLTRTPPNWRDIEMAL